MSRHLQRRIGIPILILSAALVAPSAALAGHPHGFPADVLVGTPGPDTLFGGPHADIIFGLAGDDWLYGGVGADPIFAGPGEDNVRGGEGPDTLRGGLGVDHIGGGPGNDLILVAGDGSADFVWCGDGRQDLAIVDPNDHVANDCEFVWARDPEN